MGDMQRVTITYADLVDGDTLVDKSGNEWPVSKVILADPDLNRVDFWLGSPPLHAMTKTLGEMCTVLRPETQAVEVERREAEVDAAAAAQQPEPVEPTTAEQAQAEVADQMGAEVVAVETAADAEVRKAAEAGMGPAALPPFEAFTDLERKSHLYLLHGVYAEDIVSRDDLAALHAKLHADENHRPVAHHHDAANPFPGDPSEQR